MGRLPWVLVAVWALAGCGYKAGFNLPPHLRTFAVNTFTNKTLEKDLDFEFTQALIQEILAKTQLRVARPEVADLVINGEIDELDRQTILDRRYGEKVVVSHVLYVNVEMLDRQNEQVFFQGRRISREADYNVDLGETPRKAREEAVRELARRVVSMAFERWPPTPLEAKAVAK